MPTCSMLVRGVAAAAAAAAAACGRQRITAARCTVSYLALSNSPSSCLFQSLASFCVPVERVILKMHSILLYSMHSIVRIVGLVLYLLPTTLDIGFASMELEIE